MFAQTLSGTRQASGLSLARLAQLAGTSRPTLSDYEAGRKRPRVDTAERILSAEGFQLAAAHRDRFVPRIAPGIVDELTRAHVGRQAALAAAERNIPLLVDADVNAERLGLTWGQVKTRSLGTTVAGGDPLDLWRLSELADSVSGLLRSVRAGDTPSLRMFARDTFVEAPSIAEDRPGDAPARALAFLVRATYHGADPALARHRVCALLVSHGYPWLYVPHRAVAEYRQALVACLRVGDGNPMLRILLSSLDGSLDRGHE